MNSLSDKEASQANDDLLDQFQQLLLNYVRQVGRRFPSDKSIQKAVKTLEKSVTKPR